MSGLVQVIPTYKLGQELPGFEGWPAALPILVDAEDLEPFVVKEEQPDGSPKYIVAVVGALMMEKPGKLDHALMVTGHKKVVVAELDDIFVITAHLDYPEKEEDTDSDFDIDVTMDHYWGRP
jgi:hypothetical protein